MKWKWIFHKYKLCYWYIIYLVYDVLKLLKLFIDIFEVDSKFINELDNCIQHVFQNNYFSTLYTKLFVYLVITYYVFMILYVF